MTPFDFNQRTFSFLKLNFLLIIVLNYEIQQGKEIYRQYFERDLEFCPECFHHQKEKCENFFNSLEYDSAPTFLQSLIQILPPLNSDRAFNFVKFKSSPSEGQKKIISKYLADAKMKSLNLPLNKDEIREAFFQEERIEGLQFCPSRSEEKLISFLKGQTKHSELSLWLHLMLNAEPLLMPLMEDLNFPVPHNFLACGFTLYQEYVGSPLNYFFKANFDQKLQIAKELLEGVLKFSKGFDNFRVYITDLNPDNVVYEEKSGKLHFVDLDTVLIVDGGGEKIEMRRNHKHEFIECENCFAYSQKDICSYSLSDINIYSVCQLLREDLNHKRESGFLYPIPSEISQKYPELIPLLDTCVDCQDRECKDRFQAAEKLIQLFERILKEFYSR